MAKVSIGRKQAVLIGIGLAAAVTGIVVVVKSSGDKKRQLETKKRGKLSKNNKV